MNGGLCCTLSSNFTARLSPTSSVHVWACAGTACPGHLPVHVHRKLQRFRMSGSLLISRLPLACSDTYAQSESLFEESMSWLFDLARVAKAPHSRGGERAAAEVNPGEGDGDEFETSCSNWANGAGFVAWCFLFPTNHDFSYEHLWTIAGLRRRVTTTLRHWLRGPGRRRWSGASVTDITKTISPPNEPDIIIVSVLSALMSLGMGFRVCVCMCQWVRVQKCIDFI